MCAIICVILSLFVRGLNILGRNQYFPLSIITVNVMGYLVIWGPDDSQVKYIFYLFPAVKYSPNMTF